MQALIRVIEKCVCGVCSGHPLSTTELLTVYVGGEEGVQGFINPSHDETVDGVAHGDWSPSVGILPLPFTFEQTKGFTSQPDRREGILEVAKTNTLMHNRKDMVGQRSQQVGGHSIRAWGFAAGGTCKGTELID